MDISGMGMGSRNVGIVPAGGHQYRTDNIKDRIETLLNKIDRDMEPVKRLFRSPDRVNAYDNLLDSKKVLSKVSSWIKSIPITRQSNGTISTDDLKKIHKALNQFKGHHLFGTLDKQRQSQGQSQGQLMTERLIKYFDNLIKFNESNNCQSNQLKDGVIDDLGKVVAFLNSKKTEIVDELGRLMTELRGHGNKYLQCFDDKTENIEPGFKIQSVVGASEICKGQDGVAICGKVAVLVDVVTADNNWHLNKEDRAKFHVECAVYAKARPQIMAKELNEFFERTPGATPDQIKAKILEIDELISRAFKAKFNNRISKFHEPLKYPTSTIKIAIIDSNKQSVHLFLQGDGNEFVVNPNEDQTYTWTALRDPESQEIKLSNGQACPGQSGPSSPLSAEPEERVRFLDYTLVQNAKYLVIGSDGIEAEELMQKKPDQIPEIPHKERPDDASTLIIQFETPTKRKRGSTDYGSDLNVQKSPKLSPLTIKDLQQNAFEWCQYIDRLIKDGSINEDKLRKIKQQFSMFIQGPKAVESINISDKYSSLIGHIKSTIELSQQSIGQLLPTIIEIIIESYVVELSDIETRLKESNGDHQAVHDFIHFIQGLDRFLTFIDKHFYKEEGDESKPRILASIRTLRNLIEFNQAALSKLIQDLIEKKFIIKDQLIAEELGDFKNELCIKLYREAENKSGTC